MWKFADNTTVLEIVQSLVQVIYNPKCTMSWSNANKFKLNLLKFKQLTPLKLLNQLKYQALH